MWMYSLLGNVSVGSLFKYHVYLCDVDCVDYCLTKGCGWGVTVLYGWREISIVEQNKGFSLHSLNIDITNITVLFC